MKKKIIFTDKPVVLEKYVSRIKQMRNADITVYQDYAKDSVELIERGKGAQIVITDAILPYSKEVLSSWPTLEIIITTSVGTDHIDLVYCKKMGIKVINFPGFNARSVAEMAFANLITLLRRIPLAQQHVKSGGWKYEPFEGEELAGKNFGIIGAGNIGQELIKIGQGMGMDIFCNTNHPSPSRAKKLKIGKFYSFDEVLQKADFIALAVPATAETENLIDAKALKKMKNSAYLINVSRYKVVDALALAKALYRKEIAGAALDVIGPEPYNLKDDNLLIQEMVNLPNVILTPHIAWNTKEASERLGERLVEKMIEVIKDSRG